MKSLARISIAIFLACLIYACKKQSATAPLNDSLPGTWNITQTYLKLDSGIVWGPASALENAEYITFSSDGKLASSIPYIKGYNVNPFTTYTITDTVTLKFIRDDKTYENYHYTIKKGTLELSQIGPDTCLGCAKRFRKTSN